jgi:hypothetical protein
VSAIIVRRASRSPCTLDLTRHLFGMNWRETSHRHENRELIIRQLLPSVREKAEFLRMSLMKIPGHARGLISGHNTRRTS